MAAKLLFVIAAIQIACATPQYSPVPIFGGVGHGRAYISWFGFKGTISMGRFLGGNSTDGGLMFQLRIPPGPKCMILFDGVMSREQGIGGHVMIGSQLMFGTAMAAGMGCNLQGLHKRFGAVFATKSLVRNHTYTCGSYSYVLRSLAHEYLRT